MGVWYEERYIDKAQLRGEEIRQPCTGPNPNKFLGKIHADREAVRQHGQWLSGMGKELLRPLKAERRTSCQRGWSNSSTAIMSTTVRMPPARSTAFEGVILRALRQSGCDGNGAVRDTSL